MVKVSTRLLSTVTLLFSLAGSARAQVQETAGSPGGFRLWEFDEISHTCRAKGRLQDRDYCASKMMDQIVAQGKAAIPTLISELTDTRRTKEPIYDHWSYTNAGDIAYFVLTNLFTDSNWTTFNMPGLEDLNEKCGEAAETCWRRFLTKHGRKFVQDRWLSAWNANKERVYWDETARCFRLSPRTK
jgi:hypothetical protein